MSRISSILLGALLVVAAPRAFAQGSEPTLWIADDAANAIYEVTRDGTFISTFRQQRGADSCAAVDTLTDTLWSTAESANRIVNFSKTGEIPPACTACELEISVVPLGAEGPEGIDVDPSDGTLWLVDDALSPSTPTIYHIEGDGTLISSFPTSSFDLAALSPRASPSTRSTTPCGSPTTAPTRFTT